jgi:hypothetical protein
MERSITHVWPVMVVTLAVTLGLGCASETAARHEEAPRLATASRAPTSHVQQATYENDEASPEMTVTGEEGTLNAADVEGAVQEHAAEILDCYRAGRRTSPHTTGHITLRFFVDGKGEVDDVSIVESNLGNHAVERCIADVGLGVVFERPVGHKPTTFDYPFEFRPARQVTAERVRKP